MQSSEKSAAGTLYVIATPLGNLEDLSARAGRMLAEVDLIAAEDTRRTGRLLQHLGLAVDMVSCHEHSGTGRLAEIKAALESGSDVGLVSDAGTPLLSDPGFELVAWARASGVRVIPIPGPSAVTAALSVAGLATDRFLFVGFPPGKHGPRRAFLEALAPVTSTIVLFESCHRIASSVAMMRDVLGSERRAFLGREMTKLYEQYAAGSLAELAGDLAAGRMPPKGEFVVVVEGARAPDSRAREDEARRLLAVLADELPVSRAAKAVAKLTGVARARCYELAERIRDA